MVSATGAAAAAAAAAKAAAMCGAVTAAAAGMVAAPAMASSSARRVRHAFFMARLRHVLHWPHRSSLRMMPYLLERRRLMCGSPPIASARLGVCGSGTGLRNAGFFAGAAGSGAQGSVVPPTSDFGGGPGAAAAGHGNGGGLCPEKEAAVAPRAAGGGGGCHRRRRRQRLRRCLLGSIGAGISGLLRRRAQPAGQQRRHACNGTHHAALACLSSDSAGVNVCYHELNFSGFRDSCRNSQGFEF